MIQTRIYLDGEYRLVRARTRDGLFSRIAKMLGGNSCSGRLEGWNDEAQIYQLTVCRSLPRRYGSGCEIVRELSVSLPRSVA